MAGCFINYREEPLALQWRDQRPNLNSDCHLSFLENGYNLEVYSYARIVLVRVLQPLKA